PTELFPNISNGDIARALGEQEATAKAADARDEARKQRHAEKRGDANYKYNITNRPLPFSYIVQGEDGQFARVDGTDFEDISYFASRGYKRVSEPVSLDEENRDKVRRTVKSMVEMDRPVPKD